jgi:tRNA pseudouridine55 synthase
MEHSLHGFLVIDKPKGISSREAVDRVQAALPRGVRVGHTGTLDPLATGVLVVAVGQATRLADLVQRQTKEYSAGVRFGLISATDDAEGPLTAVAGAILPTREQLEGELAKFLGLIEQTPPAFSAVHVDGQRAYRRARQGKTVDLKPKTVRIEKIDLLDYRPPDVEMTVRCGKGTFIRSIARDLGAALGCGAYLRSLRRTRVGLFLESQALPPDATIAEFAAQLRPLADAAAEMPRLTLTDDDVRRLSMGQAISMDNESPGAESAIFDEAGELRAIATIVDGRLKPTKVFLREAS